MRLATLKNKLKREYASDFLGQGSAETQLAFSFEFSPKPSKLLNLKWIIKKLLVARIVGFGFVFDTFKDKLILTAKAINNFKRSLNCRVGDIESIKFRGT